MKEQKALHIWKCNTRNGISHGNLTDPAFALLKGTLESYGNVLSVEHQTALLELLGALSNFARGDLKGRRVYALSTGMGKSSAVLSWLAALHQLGDVASHVSVAVSASKVEALCGMKQSLLNFGLPESALGLKHSLGNAASLPSTGDDDRRFMFVTHARVRGMGRHQLFTEHKGKPRAVLIFDETMFRSHCIALSEVAVRSELAYFTEQVIGRAECAGLVEYLTQARSVIVEAVNAAKGNSAKATTVILPNLDEMQRQGYAEILRGRSMADSLGHLVALAGETLRVAFTAQSGGVLWHQVAIPESLENVLVLDASFPIRKLCHLDPTLKPGSKFSGAPVKRFDHVVINHMPAYGGRYSVERSFREVRRESRAISREVVDVVKNIPATESVLIFSFKKRAVDIQRILLEDMREAGIDTSAVCANGKPRVNILCWGDECGLNDYSSCSNIILAGVLHRGLLDIASVVVGQLDDSTASLDNEHLREMLEGEIAHSVFQALSRGRCREIDNGQAKPMRAWLIHHGLSIRPRIDEVMPGVQWNMWEPTVRMASDGLVVRMTLRLHEYLQKLPATVRTISTRAVKESMGILKSEKDTFTRSLKSLPEMSMDWAVVGRSLVRADASHYGFST